MLMKANIHRADCDVATDLIVLSTNHNSNYAARFTLYALYLALVGEVTLTANEHVEVAIMAGWDTLGSTGTYDWGSYHQVHHERNGPLFSPVTNHTAADYHYTGLLTDGGAGYAASNQSHVWNDGWNIQIPYKQIWMPDERPVIFDYNHANTSVALYWSLRLPDGFSATTTVNATIIMDVEPFLID